VAYGTELLNEKGTPFKGTVKIYDLTSQKQVKELGGHKAGVSDIKFSPDGLLLASAGLDKRMHMWVVDHEEDLPILMDNNNGQVWDMAFTAGSDFLLTSCNNGEIRVWPTDPKMLAEEVCPKLPRNMTPEEWNTYVANGITYESTCRSLLIKDF
jgi:WD40 repeat protein